MHDDLHRLTVPRRVSYKLALTAHRCLQHRVPRYLTDYCVPVSEVPGRQHRSARRRQLSVPRVRHSTFGSLCHASMYPLSRLTNRMEFTAK